jgi:hypothetical protein
MSHAIVVELNDARSNAVAEFSLSSSPKKYF